MHWRGVESQRWANLMDKDTVSRKWFQNIKYKVSRRQQETLENL